MLSVLQISRKKICQTNTLQHQEFSLFYRKAVFRHFYKQSKVRK
ncbi:hypothetical protein HMPREF9151_01105 [Hoylesella saccharolytica F0055]|uniref:Uncharacterized protein n=1 Tax=Hoylesella saccharolytica F0055 TaxID=1127699 RepID=L1NCR2_9BACT|nr:hypothetical protein HMPREF9151_01105 [Hoylesella saccharolytica F0055]